MANRLFHKLDPLVWSAPSFRWMTSQEKLLYLYFLSNGHVNSSGYARLPLAYICNDLDWTVDQLLEPLLKLKTSGEIVRDTETDEIFVSRWFEHNPPMSPSHYVKVQRDIANCHSQSVGEVISSAALTAHGPKLAEWEAREKKRKDKEMNKSHLIELMSTPHMKGHNRDGGGRGQ